MFDALGDRMKDFYESRTKVRLQRRTYTIIRIDGKAFHSFTKGFERPFSNNLMNLMDETAAAICANIQGAKMAFVQSDEISILITDFDKLTTDAWFDGNLQKMSSVAASLATGFFNSKLNLPSNSYKEADGRIAFFDARVFQLPTKTEVENYFIWRQQDCTRNSISSVAQFLYSPKELNGKSSNEQQEMIFQKGINWNDYDAGCKRGRIIFKEEYAIQPTGPWTAELKSTTRTRWTSSGAHIFSQDKSQLVIPENV